MTPARPRQRPDGGAADARLAAAHAAKVLAAHDPAVADYRRDLIVAAVAFARGQVGADEERLLWGRYGYRAAIHLQGAHHQLTVLAGRTYQQILADQGLHVDVVLVCRDRLAAYRQRGNPARVLTAHLDLITALHNNGECDSARRRITDLQRHQPTRDPHGQLHIVLTRAVTAAGCGRTLHARGILLRNADLLANAPRSLDQAARWLAAAERKHPDLCQHPRTSDPIDLAERTAFWRTCMPAAPTASGRPR